MKKLLSVILLILFIFLTISESYSQNIFPGKDTSLISGQNLKVKPIDDSFKKYGYRGFYQDVKLKKKYKCCDYIDTKYEALVNKELTVQKIIPNGERFILVLNSSETGLIYFDYNPTLSRTWYFEMLNEVKLSEDFYCKEIKSKTDKFDKSITYTTESEGGFSFILIKRDGNAFYYLRKNLAKSSLASNPSGFYIIFDDGSRFEKSGEKIEVSISPLGGSYVYSALVELTKEELRVFTEKKITDVKLHVFDEEVKNGNIILEFAKCVSNI